VKGERAERSKIEESAKMRSVPPTKYRK